MSEVQIMSVDHSVQFISELGNVAVMGVRIAKSGFSWWDAVSKIMPLIKEIKVMVDEAKGAIPELKDLDTEETLQLGQAAFDCITKVVRSIVE